MAINWSLFSGRTGMLRIITLVLGAIDLGITADKYWSTIAKEEFFLAMVIIMFIISLIWCVLFILEILTSTDILKKVDMAFHVIGGLLLIISGIVYLVSVFRLWDHCAGSGCTSHRILRLIAGILGIINGIVYGMVGYTLYGGNI